MKIQMKPEIALYCPKHGRQMYYTTSVGKKPEKWCSRRVKERKHGDVVAYVSKSGKVLYTDYPGWFKVKFKSETPIFYMECYERLTERMIAPKREYLLKRIWKQDWSSGIWRCEANRDLAVSRHGKRWQYYAPQFNTPEINKKTNYKIKAWLYGGKTRITAMKTAIRNLESIKVPGR